MERGAAAGSERRSAMGVTFVAMARFIPMPVVIAAVLFSALPTILLIGAAVNAAAKRR